MNINKFALSSIVVVALLSACASNSTNNNTSNADSNNTAETVASNQLNLRNDAPQSYVVKSGDTLWSISAKFLNSPWQWKSLWKANPNIKNPHRIYPGDSLQLVNGQLSIKSRSQGIQTVKLSPGVRQLPIDLGIPVVSYQLVESTLTRSIITDAKTIANAPYVLANEDSAIQGVTNKRIYIKGAVQAGAVYDVFRQYQAHKNIGIEIVRVGQVTVERAKDGNAAPSSAFITILDYSGVLVGDILIPKSKDSGIPNLYFYPEPAPRGMRATIISAPRTLNAVGSGQTILINKGSADGVKPGFAFVAESRVRTATDPRTGQRITLPSEAVGTIMVYKTFEHASYALVMTSPDPIYIGTTVSAPKDAR
ncbi:hypothetical protein AwWohl_00410 [Gammaproteobacteria bacterium]|nr:hypothetical protein AwWohl_00410 [Gammaproteobacteria bacterium]